MKILHSADWHLASPLQGRTPEQTRLLRQALLEVPGKVAALCRQERCDMMLLSGDLLDGPADADSVNALKNALAEAAVPVFISPGNHDFAAMDSPWLTQSWPDNVHIFTEPAVRWVDVPALGCRVYGAGFTSMDCESLLEGFRADPDTLSLGVFHGDPAQANSPYNPVSQSQVANSGLQYLALGHIHKCGSFRAGSTLCAWPGCPMGRGYDETGEKGVLIVTLEGNAQARFVSLDTPRFHDVQLSPAALDALLPPVGNGDFYRVTLIGESALPDLEALSAQYSRFPNLLLRDRTQRPVDIWKALGEDSFEGTFFGLLHDALESADADTKEQILLSARICRQILDGQEVALP